MKEFGGILDKCHKILEEFDRNMVKLEFGGIMKECEKIMKEFDFYDKVMKKKFFYKIIREFE